MKLVKENINFERGQDPQAALGIGLKPEIVELRKKLSEMYDENYPKVDDPFYAGQNSAIEYATALIDELSIMKDGNS
jgi:hypothetical protein